MSSTLSPVAPTTDRNLRLPALALAAGGLVLAVLAAADHGGPAYWVTAVVAGAWAVGAFLVARRLPRRPLALLMGLLALVLGAALYAAAKVSGGDDGYEMARSILTALLPAVVLHLAFAVPDGVLPSRSARTTVGIGYVAAVALGVALGSESGDLPVLPYVLAALVVGAVGLVGYTGRCRKASAADRARLQWVGLGCGAGRRVRHAGRPPRSAPGLARPSGHGRHRRHRRGPRRVRGLHGAPPPHRHRPGAGPDRGRGRPAGVGRGRLPVRGRRPGPGARGRGALGAGPVDAGGRGSVPCSPSRPGTAWRRSPTSGSTASATGPTTPCAPSPGACPAPCRWTSSCSSWPSR